MAEGVRGIEYIDITLLYDCKGAGSNPGQSTIIFQNKHFNIFYFKIHFLLYFYNIKTCSFVHFNTVM